MLMNGVQRQAVGNEGTRGMSNYMNNVIAHIRPLLHSPISSPVSAGNRCNETVSEIDQIDAFSTLLCSKGRGSAESRVL